MIRSRVRPEPLDPSHAVPARDRWLSPRALLLHFEVAIVAPGCALAGWWQATRALAGNELSWAYSVEWPALALLSIAGWWHLIHEDPEAYRARKNRSPVGEGGPVEAVPVEAAPALPVLPGRDAELAVERVAARWATALAVLVGFEFVFGVVALFSVPLDRPSASLPTRGEAVYLVHAIFGVLLIAGAIAFLVRVRSAARTPRVVGWVGFIGVMLAGAGGLLTEAQSLGMALMFVGAALAGFGYVIPILLRLSRQVPAPRPSLDRPDPPQLPVI